MDGEALRAWRRQNLIKQEALAEMLGIRQASVSRWETGADRPSPLLARRLRDLVHRNARDTLARERAILAPQAGVRAVFALAGLRLVAHSAGLARIWPRFAARQGEALHRHLVGDSAALLDGPGMPEAFRDGEIIQISGVSERHTDLAAEGMALHRWHAGIRPAGGETLIDICFEPVPPGTPTGVERMVRLSDLTA